jgi:branched-chain amino acid aminotransferase
MLASDLVIERNQNPKTKPESADNLAFGAVFTDHMLEIDWTLEHGWGTPTIKPFGNLSLVRNPTFFVIFYIHFRC